MIDLKTLLSAMLIFVTAAGSFLAGVTIAVEHGVERCPSWHVKQNDQTVILLTAPAGSDGVQCIMVRGYFEGEPSKWRYLSPLQ